ncbi:hypothetical protein ACH4FX_12500 [Streptomyces sp. NPDC018019]|uniref:hypothetical protein n=1 Tax=Streptomyces sp. NPDC018019 TaxID=3365030 RepID=UPI0037911072
MTVAELLARTDARELAEWAAYERYAGPLGPAYRDEALAAIHEQLQRLNRIQGAAHFTDKKHRKNPAPEPKPYPRPREVFRREEDDEEDGTTE